MKKMNGMNGNLKVIQIDENKLEEIFVNYVMRDPNSYNTYKN